MQIDDFLKSLAAYERGLNDILHDIDNLEPPEIWKTQARQYIHEIIELIEDVTHWNDYAQRIMSGIGNGKSISKEEIESILVIVRTAITRFRRRPELINPEETPVAPTFGEPFQFAEARVRPPPNNLTLQASTGEFSINASAAELTLTDTASLHKALMGRLLALEYILKQRPITNGAGIGHNRPPPDEEDAAQGAEQDLAEDRNVHRCAQGSASGASGLDRKRWSTQVAMASKISTRLLGYFDKFADKAAEAAGEEFGKRAMQLPFGTP